jgi:signal transduction histidine kinase
MIGVMMMWFTTQYTKLGKSRFVPGWTAFGVVLIAANSLSSFSVLYNDVRRVDGFALPWGEQIFLTEAVRSPLALLFALFPAGVFVYTIYCCVQQFVGGDKRAASLLGGIAFLIGTAAAHDLIVDVMSIKTLSLFEFALLIMVILLTSQFSDEIISAERDLRVYQTELETLVSRRTSELSAANVLLGKAVNVRAQAEKMLQNRVRDLNALSRISQTITLATVDDLAIALESVADLTRSLFNANSCHMYTVDATLGHSVHLRQVLARLDIRAALSPGVEPLDVPAIKHAAIHGESINIEESVYDERIKSGRDYLLADFVHAMMIVPLKVRGATIGCIAAVSQDPARRFTASEMSLFENIAGDVASALENARLYFQAQQSAVDIERQRLARELHDSVTQSLYSLTLLANGWGTMAKTGKPLDVPGSFMQLVEVGQQALKEMRLLIHQLRPPILEEAGLAGALRQRLEVVEKRVDIHTKLVVEGPLDGLSMDVQEQLFHIAQEALNNSLRHSEARNVLIQISVDRGGVVMSVEDDGVGFDPDTVSPGMGTLTIRDRARQIRGSVNVRSAVNAGTTVEVTVQPNPQPAL